MRRVPRPAQVFGPFDGDFDPFDDDEDAVVMITFGAGRPPLA